jgi:hypothetical protein
MPSDSPVSRAARKNLVAKLGGTSRSRKTIAMPAKLSKILRIREKNHGVKTRLAAWLAVGSQVSTLQRLA